MEPGHGHLRVGPAYGRTQPGRNRGRGRGRHQRVGSRGVFEHGRLWQQLLVSADGTNAFVAKLTDTGNTSNFTWAQQAGGTSDDRATALACTGAKLYVAGSFSGTTGSFGSFAITGPSGSLEPTAFFAALTDPTLTATAAQSTLSFSLSPNPARTAAILTLPALPGTATATLTLRDALGRTVRTQTLPLPAAGLRHELDLTGLPAGLYAVRVQAGAATATRRLVVE